ncbi:MAG TPA: 2-C-methyl-D-erythritol 2,4-cyclodiphosphate synthase [bacterium]|nr:2-C-methyl-D-erythritol 2,4-cyclodiphosphate synthase [bacterium]
MRVGFGYDIHPLVPGRRLILGGVLISFDKGLRGHSDADVLCHAVSDALLGAAALGDIGLLFPDTDPGYRDADSLMLLRQVAEKVRNAGYEISNIDTTVVAEAPRIKPHRDAMIRNLAGALGLSPGRVSVKATTNEKLDATGRGEAIAAHAVVMLRAAGDGMRDTENG